MQNEWFARLIEAIEADGRSMNDLSLSAGLGRNFISQMKSAGKVPSLENFGALLSALGDEATYYVLIGVRASREDLEAMLALQGLSPRARSLAFSFFRALQGDEETPMPDPSLAD